MTDSVLDILKIALLALLYLFFARVLWAVWSEVRGPRQGTPSTPHAAPVVNAPLVDPTQPAPTPIPPNRQKRVKADVAQKLVVLVPKERKGASFMIGQELVIGRAPHCQITISDDPFVSNLHLRVFRNADRTWVEDLGSTNGSYLNGNRLGSVQPFSKGDRLQVGSTVLEGQ